MALKSSRGTPTAAAIREFWRDAGALRASRGEGGGKEGGSGRGSEREGGRERGREGERERERGSVMIRGRTRHLLRADAQCGNIIGEQPPPRAIRGRSGFALAELGRPDQRRGRGHGEDGISATANSNRRVTNACWIYAFGAELISNKGRLRYSSWEEGGREGRGSLVVPELCVHADCNLHVREDMPSQEP